VIADIVAPTPHAPYTWMQTKHAPLPLQRAVVVEPVVVEPVVVELAVVELAVVADVL